MKLCSTITHNSFQSLRSMHVTNSVCTCISFSEYYYRNRRIELKHSRFERIYGIVTIRLSVQNRIRWNYKIVHVYVDLCVYISERETETGTWHQKMYGFTSNVVKMHFENAAFWIGTEKHSRESTQFWWQQCKKNRNKKREEDAKKSSQTNNDEEKKKHQYQHQHQLQE